MIRFMFKILSAIVFILVKMVVLWIPAFILPIVFLYANRLNAENIPDPLEGHAVVRMNEKPDMITIPVPAKSIRKGTLISESDLTLHDVTHNLVNDMIAQDMMQLIGQEAKKTLYQNKPILLRDVGSMTMIKRNDTVTMEFKQGGMTLQTIGRAMDDGGIGDTIKVMNEQSKKIVTGRINKQGAVDVSL